MNSGFFDVFHDSADDCDLAVRNRINVNFDCVFQKLVDQNRLVRRNINSLGHVRLQRLLVVTNHHRTATKNIAGANKNRIADSSRSRAGAFDVGGDAVGRLMQTELIQNDLKATAIFRRVDAVGTRSNNRYTGRFQAASKVQRCLAAELNNHTIRLHAIADI